MKTVLKWLAFVFIMTGIMTYTGCEKEDEIRAVGKTVENPTLTTNAASRVTTTSAVTGGIVNFTGIYAISACGVCWDTIPNPTIDDNKMSANIVGIVGPFTCNLTGLNPNTTYFLRSYLTNSVGTIYGNEITFISNPLEKPGTIATLAVTSITNRSAFSGGNIIDDARGSLTEWGVCWSTSEYPTIHNSRFSIYGGPNAGRTFSYNISGLNPGTTYFVRAYAINTAGVAYGEQMIFTTFQNPQTKIADFPGTSINGAANFTIGTKEYIGLGFDDGDFQTRDFWEWDHTTNIWTRKASFPGILDGQYVCFSIGTKGYVQTGGDFYDNGDGQFITIPNEFWEYDPFTNAWTQKANLPSATWRSSAAGFSIGTKGYIGLGRKAEDMSAYYSDFWEYDQITNVWTRKADYPGSVRVGAVGFSIGNKGYFGTGNYGTTGSKDFWEWDQTTNVWTRKADFGGGARSGAVGFSSGNKGYIGLGTDYNGQNLTSYSDIWEWEQSTNEWSKVSDFAGKTGGGSIGFSIGNKGYIGIEYDWTSSSSKIFWAFDLPD